MNFIQPLSVAGELPSYDRALPPPTPELDGQMWAVGTPLSAIVYRCNYNIREPSKSYWAFTYHVWRK